MAAGERRRDLNCSGKHSGKLLACSGRGGTPRRTSTGASAAAAILAGVAAGTGLEGAVGVDGCGAPVHAVTLAGMAASFRPVGRPRTPRQLRPAAHRAVSAMLAAPYLVAGRNRLGTPLMERAVGEGGAEGLSCSASLTPPGMAVKMPPTDRTGPSPGRARGAPAARPRRRRHIEPWPRSPARRCSAAAARGEIEPLSARRAWPTQSTPDHLTWVMLSASKCLQLLYKRWYGDGDE